MKQEDLWEKILGKLKYSEKTLSFSRILSESKSFEWTHRNFNADYTWSLKKATFFIESVLLRCELQPIILFRHHDTSVICDGFNRLTTLIHFFTNELTLIDSGLLQLNFLANKKFKDLPMNYQDYLLKNCTFKIGIYELYDHSIPLTIDDYEYIEKQLYIRYNTGIQLKTFQLQKAQFGNDPITQNIINELKNNSNYLEQLTQLKIVNASNGNKKIDIGMVKIRNLLALTYSPLELYMKQRSNRNIANIVYSRFVPTHLKNETISFFWETIKILFTFITELNLELYPSFYNYNFIEVTYWLVTTIIKDQLFDIKDFDWKNYIQYCIENDSPNGYFKQVVSSYKEKKEKFFFVAHFIEKRYSIDMTTYFNPNYQLENEEKQKEKDVLLFDDLFKKRYITINEEKDVKEISQLMHDHCFILKPYYQRNEEKRIREASGIIESCILNIRIPSILIYRYFKNQKQIYEVVDGQQRCLSLLSYQGLEYLNEDGIFEKSEKQNFTLTKLKVLNNLENCSYQRLSKEYQQKIAQTDISLSIIDQNDNPEFDPVEHYIRINSNINPLKTDSYLMWNVACDKMVMQKINEITKEHIHKFFQRKSKNKNYETFITICAYHEFQNQKRKTKARKWRNISNRDITFWLEAINDKNRFLYLTSIELVHKNLEKIEAWLNYIEESPISLYGLHANASLSNQRLEFLYYLLSDIPENILNKKARFIQKNIIEFSQYIKKENLTVQEKIEILQSSKVELKIIQLEFYKTQKVLQ